ncbi:MAG: PKD domain-containing protein, partial [Planctomycetota bacterium]
ELNGYDNIIWEISNESHSGSELWQFHMIDHIKSYEASKPKQHLVWININQTYLFDSANHADVVSPSAASIYRTDPPHATGAKVIISDSDHIGPSQATYPWIWKAITRGQHPVFMDGYLYHLSWYDGTYDPNDPKNQRMRDAMGITLTYANRMNLVSTVPQAKGTTSPSSTAYCLYESGKQYLVYQPVSGAFTLNLPAGAYDYEWVHPYNGTTAYTGTIDWAGGNRSFTPPIGGDSVLYLAFGGKPFAVIDANPTKGFSPLTVNFDGTGSYDLNGTIVSYEWDFDNNGTVDSTAPITSHEYWGVNEYIASLKVTDNDGLSRTTTVNISVVYPLGDFDHDDDVDQEDFGHFQECITGTGNPQNDPNCLDVRLDGDDDVDINDFTLFVGCMSGADIKQTDPGCIPN